jgi:actin-related protein 3
LFFNPEIFTDQFTTPLPEVVDNVITSCPIDTRKPLYRNIVLSGGSTMFSHFARRLERDISLITGARIAKSRSISKGLEVKDIEVNVMQHDMQRYAVWFGGSMFGSTPEIYNVSISKADYEEKGPGVARHSKVFGAMTM